MPAQYRCGQLGRRLAVRDASPPTLNGIDYLEVGDDQQTLEVHFLHPLAGSPPTLVFFQWRTWQRTLPVGG